MSASPPIPKELVLPTLNQDGTRRRIRPKLYQGTIYTRRFYVAWALMILFVSLPLVHVGSQPAVFLDVASREFTFFGRTFFATDGVLLMFLMLSIFIGIIGATALVGRAWCGWGCPQTVYMEFLFRPIERLLEGDRNAQLKLDARGGGGRRVIKHAIFLVLSVAVANVFLSYFVGAKTLFTWMSQSPTENPGGFAVMGVTAGLVFFDFAYFREQMCTVICPYARLQAALFDKDSLTIGYDGRRGEPRHKGKPGPTDGDCVDCGACVVACPTGIDIRQGSQLECVACGQCVDACNFIMPRVHKPLGLIRYASERSLAGGERRIFRTRVFVYAGILTVLVTLLLTFGSGRTGADVTILRAIGAPFVLQGDKVQAQVRVKVANRGREPQTYHLSSSLGQPHARASLETLGGSVVIPESELVVAPKSQATTSVFFLFPPSAFQSGRLSVVLDVKEPDGNVVSVSYLLLGPKENSL